MCTPTTSQAPSTGCARTCASSSCVERRGLRQHRGRDVHLADVVKSGAELQLLDSGLAPAEPAGDRLGVPSHALGVLAELGVGEAHDGGEGRDRRHDVTQVPGPRRDPFS